MQDEVEWDGAIIWRNTTPIDGKKKVAETEAMTVRLMDHDDNELCRVTLDAAQTM